LVQQPIEIIYVQQRPINICACICEHPLSINGKQGLHAVHKSTGIPRFTSLIRSSKPARKAKTRKTKINFPLLP
jgi:hypothetical protein